MGRESRKTGYLSEIRTLAQLREVRRELEIREWLTRERLMDDIHDTFTLGNLISMVAPPGSLVNRIVGSVGTGFSVAQSIIEVIGAMLGGRAARRPAPAREDCRDVATAGKAADRTASRHAAKRTVDARPAARKQSAGVEDGIAPVAPVAPEPKKPKATRRKKQ